MLCSDCNKSVAIVGKLNVMNLIRATLVLPGKCHVSGLDAVDSVVIVQVNTGNIVSIFAPGDSVDTSGSLWELESSL